MMKERQLSLFASKNESAGNKNRYKLILPLDALFLGSAVAILLLILSFSLGVERGKKIASASIASSQAQDEKVEPLKNIRTKKAKIQEDTPPQEPIKQAQEKSIKKDNVYRIQVASFHKENSANAEAQKLKNDGYQVLTMRKGDWVAVYVGSFEDEKEAESNLKDLREKYADCILRRL